MNKMMTTPLLALTILGLMAAGSANADIRVKCERKGNRSSVVSVDGKNLGTGPFTAEIESGSNTAKVIAPKTSVAGEVEFDFSSKPKDVAAGATAITPNFIQGGKVTASILKDGFVVNSFTANCRVR